MRRSLSSLTSDRMWRPASPGLEWIGDAADQVAVAPRNAADARRQRGNATSTSGSKTVVAQRGSRPTSERTLQSLPGAVRQAQDVVEEAVLLVPHLVGVIADGVHRGSDPEEPLEELQHEVLVGRGRARRAPTPAPACSGCRAPSTRCRRPARGCRRWAATRCGRTRRCCRGRGTRPRTRLPLGSLRLTHHVKLSAACGTTRGGTRGRRRRSPGRGGARGSWRRRAPAG